MGSPQVWAEIDLEAIDHNIAELRRVIAPKARMLAAVKADAYGHGMIPMARRAIGNGVDMLGVARYEEGIQLRRAGIESPVLIFGYTSPDAVPELLADNLIPTVCSPGVAEAMSATASHAGRKLEIHVKIDTGMGRMGLLPNRLRRCDGERLNGLNDIGEIERIIRLPGLSPAGVYTHLACADSRDKTNASRQFECFMELLERLHGQGIEFGLRHAANSAAIIDMPETHLDMVRPGISLYGLYPSREVNRARVALKPAMALKAKIGYLKRVPAGFKVSYGSTFTTAAPTVIATVPIGYADGYRRALSSRGYMLVNGQRAPVIGRVCMDLTMLDVGHIPEAALEAEVVILGAQGQEAISADDIADMLDTINYEVVSTVMSRVPRIYF